MKTKTGDRLVLAIAVQRDDRLKLLACEEMTRSDLIPARDETWWEGVRLGRLPVNRQALSMELLPGRALSKTRLDGFQLLLSDGNRFHFRHFPYTCVNETLRRAEKRLLQQKVLKAKDPYFYFLTLIPADEDSSEDCGNEADAAAPEAGAAYTQPQPAMEVRTRSKPVPMGRAPLAQYMEDSEPLSDGAADLGEDLVNPMPVFVTGDAWREGHELSRRGGRKESAGVLVGRLMRDVDSPEVFMLIETCIEAEHAAEEDYSVTFSGETWSRVREVIELRRRRLKRFDEMILGSVHGHNFYPGSDATGKRACETCNEQAQCKQSSATASTVDKAWHRAHFTGQPWAVLLVWGWNARGEEAWRLYGLADTVLSPRPLRLLRSQ
jgi:hypothetical protein